MSTLAELPSDSVSAAVSGGTDHGEARVGQIVELRVHGVGGPQGPKILGWPSGTDVVTVPPWEHTRPDGSKVLVPPNGATRFVRPVEDEPGRPQKEAYEWGGLTQGSFTKSLWIVFLPFTFLNVGGWSRVKRGVVGANTTFRDVGARLLGYLGTVTYVLWIGYLLLEMVALQWRNRFLLIAEATGDNGMAFRVARNAMRPLAFCAFVGVLVGLALVNLDSGRDFEGVNPDRPKPDPQPPYDEEHFTWYHSLAHGLRGIEAATRWFQIAAGIALGAGLGLFWTSEDRPAGVYVTVAASSVVLGVLALYRIALPEPAPVAGQPPQHWMDDETVVHPDFFAHQLSLARLRHRHTVVGATVAGFAVALFWAGREQGQSRIGLAIVLLATAQVVVLALTWLYCLLRRRWSRFARAGLLTIGTVLCHAVFAGAALWMHDRLGSIPKGTETTPGLRRGEELALNNLFAISLGIALLVLVLSALPLWNPPTAEGVVARVARRLPISGVVMAFAFIVVFGGFTLWTVIGDPVWEQAWSGRGAWYDAPRVWYSAKGPGPEGTLLQDLGTKILVLLPVAFALSMRSSSSVGKVVGNLWDVLTFWPRRYHPFAVPPYSERAVPELRIRVDTLLQGEGSGVVLCGHSQGSVLSVAAVGPLLQRNQGKPPLALHMISFGSPLGTLFAPVFEAAVGRGAVLSDVSQSLDCGGHWTILWRKTDPIGGPIFDEQPLPDPLPLELWTPSAGVAAVKDRPPLDRPPAWRVRRVHGFYPAETEYRDAVDRAVAAFHDP